MSGVARRGRADLPEGDEPSAQKRPQGRRNTRLPIPFWWRSCGRIPEPFVLGGGVSWASVPIYLNTAGFPWHLQKMQCKLTTLILFNFGILEIAAHVV